MIAEVQGTATAAGCQLVASCDLAVASSAAQFATPGVDIGLFCSTPMVALSRSVSRKAAMEMLLTGEMVGAEEARAPGPDQSRGGAGCAVRPRPWRWRRRSRPSRAPPCRTGKEAFYRQIEMPLADAYDYASRVMTENMLKAEAEEGICAFLEKREPKWPL